jgi:uncharacterized LabA/DUF88 family protein
MISRGRNYAFIDGQNMHKGTTRQGWRVDYAKFRTYLRDTHQIEKAYVFLGYIKKNEPLYKKIEENGFLLMFKEISFGPDGSIKGNCDTDMALRICLDFWNFDKAMIVSGDGDFYSTCEVLNSVGKLGMIFAPNRGSISNRYYRFGLAKVLSLDKIRCFIS